MPLVVMLPPVADQLTAVLVEPLTVAVNCCVLPACIDAEVGETLTVTVEAAAAAGLLVRVQPARDNVIRETSAAMPIFARNCRGARCWGRAMLFPLSISS